MTFSSEICDFCASSSTVLVSLSSTDSSASSDSSGGSSTRVLFTVHRVIGRLASSFAEYNVPRRNRPEWFSSQA